ncbi:MAG TPA: DUF542 domain-containing protein [Solirubrobacterales bacterium]|nr:DUF542 domain-containing protein [Solirubrobacterales bacterium]
MLLIELDREETREMTVVDPARTLAELVLEQPGRVRTLEDFQLDYCCGGQSSLAEAAARRGLDPRAVATALEAAGYDVDPDAEPDWRDASLTELCDHIVEVHHAYLREELPRIAELFGKVVSRHGGTVPELEDVEVEFTGLRQGLIEHIDNEERALFPLCRALEEGAAGEATMPQLAMHETAHANVDDTLEVIRRLMDGYRPEQALCTTHGVLLASLERLERDLHQHIHEENNVLFPQLRERLGAPRS